MTFLPCKMSFDFNFELTLHLDPENDNYFVIQKGWSQ